MKPSTRTTVLILSVASILMSLQTCNDKNQPPFIPTQPPGPSSSMCQPGWWTINPLVNGVAYGPPSCTDNGSFVFPACPSPPSRTDGMHTLVRQSGPLSLGQTITVDFEITDADSFVGAQEQGSAAYVSLFLQRAGDNWSGTGSYNEYRAYSVNGAPPNLAPLANGRYQLSVPLWRESWTNVELEGTAQGFVDLLQNIERIGVVFGTYNSGKAHGVCPTNTISKFNMHSYTVQ